jgi:hypothetical protein
MKHKDDKKWTLVWDNINWDLYKKLRLLRAQTSCALNVNQDQLVKVLRSQHEKFKNS